MNFLNTTLFANQPAQLGPNCTTISGVYENALFATADRSGPADEGLVKAAVARATADIVWFDIECWAIDLAGDSTPDCPTQANIDKCKQVIGWARQVAPAKKFGIDGIPRLSYRQNYLYPWATAESSADAWLMYRLKHDRLILPNGDRTTLTTGYADVADFFMPGCYPGNESHDEFVRWVQDTIWLHKPLGKPTYLTLDVTHYDEFADHLKDACRYCRNQGVTVALWGGADPKTALPLPFDSKATWLDLLKL